MTVRLLGLSLAFSISAFAGTWSFESKDPAELNRCELMVWKHFMTFVYPQHATDEGILRNFKAAFGKINHANAEGKLSKKTVKQFSGINVILRGYQRHAERRHLQVILNELDALEHQFPELFEDVCSRDVTLDFGFLHEDS